MLVKMWIIGKPQIEVFTDVATKGNLTDKCLGEKSEVVFDGGSVASEPRTITVDSFY